MYSIWKRLWCWEGLGAGGKGDDRGWDGWTASPTRWTWVWVNSGSWWWTGRPGVLRFMVSQRVRHDRATELNWKKCNAKECSNYCTIALISHASKVMLKILQARLHELPDVQTGFRKGRGTRNQIANIHWIIKKSKSSRKISTSALLTMLKPLIMWTTTNSGKFLKRWESQSTWPASREFCMQVRKQQLELDTEQQTDSK